MAALAGTTLGPEVVVVVFEAAGAGREENEGVMVAWMVCEPLLSVGPFWTAVVVLLATGVGTTTTAVVWVHSSVLALLLPLLPATDRTEK